MGSEARFPQRLLAVALVLTVVLAGSVGWHVSSAHGDTNDPQQQHLRIEQLSGVIVHLDEVLTMSARMAAVTGDRRWEDRYNAHVADLDSAIKEAKRLAAPLIDAKELQDTDDANLRLVELETESFRLVRAGATDRARALLFSDEYEEQKRIYADGLALVVTRLRVDAAQTLRRERREAKLLLATTVLLAVVLLVAWTVIIRGLHRWRVALRVAEQEREKRRARPAGAAACRATGAARAGDAGGRAAQRPGPAPQRGVSPHGGRQCPAGTVRRRPGGGHHPLGGQGPGRPGAAARPGGRLVGVRSVRGRPADRR